MNCKEAALQTNLQIEEQLQTRRLRQARRLWLAALRSYRRQGAQQTTTPRHQRVHMKCVCDIPIMRRGQAELVFEHAEHRAGRVRNGPRQHRLQNKHTKTQESKSTSTNETQQGTSGYRSEVVAVDAIQLVNEREEQ